MKITVAGQGSIRATEHNICGDQQRNFVRQLEDDEQNSETE